MLEPVGQAQVAAAFHQGRRGGHQHKGLITLPGLARGRHQPEPQAGGQRRGARKRNLLNFVNKSPELAAILRSCRSYFGFALLFSLGINLLYLAGPLYMLQVYDRVMSSGSLLTLVMLTVALVLAYIALSSLDLVRARLLTRANIRLDQRVAVVRRLGEQQNAGGEAIDAVDRECALPLAAQVFSQQRPGGSLAAGRSGAMCRRHPFGWR